VMHRDLKPGNIMFAKID